MDILLDQEIHLLLRLNALADHMPIQITDHMNDISYKGLISEISDSDTVNKGLV